MARTKHTARKDSTSDTQLSRARFRGSSAAKSSSKKSSSTYVPKSKAALQRKRDQDAKKKRIQKAKEIKRKMKQRAAAGLGTHRRKGGVGFKKIIEEDVAKREKAG